MHVVFIFNYCFDAIPFSPSTLTFCSFFYYYYLSGLVRSYLALSKLKEALHAAREAMKAMPQSAKALKLVGDVHASNSSGREKVC